MRYRYALFSYDRIECFEDTPEQQKMLISKGAHAFSVHSFSEPLVKGRLPQRIWGDLHITWSEEEGSRPLQECVDYLHRYAVPESLVDLYIENSFYELIVEESAFRGELGSPARFVFDSKIKRFICSYAVNYNFYDVNGFQIPFTSVPVAKTKLAPSSSDSCKGLLGYWESCDSKVSELAHLYFVEHMKLGEKKDYIRPVLANLLKCNVFRQFINSSTYRIDEAKLLAKMIGGSAIKAFLNSCPNSTRSEDNDLIRIFDNKNMYLLLPRIACSRVSEELSAINSNLQCTSECHVPRASVLPYASKAFEVDRPMALEGCVLNSSGFYHVDSSKVPNENFRIMDPIWARDNFLGGRQIICHDMYGFRRELYLSEEDLDSPKLFSILRSHQVYVPTNKVKQGALRRYLLSQCPHIKEKSVYSISEYAGWQDDGSYIPPTETTQPQDQNIKVKSHVLPPPEDLYSFPRLGKEKFSTEATLAALFSLVAPLLRKLGMKGVCLHFHGGSADDRDLIIHAVQTVWRSYLYPVHYSLPDVKRHIAALKMHRKDSVLCVREVQEHQVKNMRSVLRRFFLGRKGSDPGVDGVIVSTGAVPLGEEKEGRKGRAGYISKGRVLAVDVELGKDRNAGGELTHSTGEVFLGKIIDGNFAQLLSEFKYYFVADKKQGSGDIVFGVLTDIATVAFVMIRWLHSAAGIPPATIDFCDQEFGNLIFRHDLELIKYGPIVVELHKIIQNAQKNPASFLKQVVPCGRGCFAITAKDFKKIIPDEVSLTFFSIWLKKKKILRLSQDKSLCGVHHFTGLGGSARAYFVHEKSLNSFLGNPIDKLGLSTCSFRDIVEDFSK
ncbi:hypothetical protein [Desulfovibrio sp. UCD-KL4C]|uniref:hypothetical protein n=1 Tax=Desulfovibrio sp. UCD-KL4C TaxID=2578120 RepID=UPI0025BEF419|nr:hypothetical protein [Desulfovibrio sp. UCD-KL4C]